MRNYLRYSFLLGWLLACTCTAYANNPVLTLVGLNPSGGDNTAFVDMVQVYTGTTGTTVVAGAVANGSFETSDALANTTYGYSPTGAAWAFSGTAGIAGNGSAFSPATAPNGTRVAFIQMASSIQQQLVLTPGTYRLSFRVSQRACCDGTNNQKLSIQLDGVELGTVQPTNTTGYDTFVSAAFTVTALSVSSVWPAANVVAADRTAKVAVTFDRLVSILSAATISVFSAQSGGKLSTLPSMSGNTVTLAPSAYFRVGEMATVVVPRTVLGTLSGEPTTPYVYQFTTNVVPSTGIFSGTLNPAAGGNAANVVVGDMNGDGRLDLVTADYGNNTGNTASVLLNTSTGTTVSFATRQAFTTGVAPYGTALGDVDGDGRLDIVVGNYDSGNGTTVSVLRNTTTAGTTTLSFAPKADYTVGTAPSGVALSDVDGDGRLDLLVANQSSNTISVLLNTSLMPGIVSFAPKVDYTVGTAPGNVVGADINGDGKLDLVSVNSGTGTVSVLRNTGLTPGVLSFATKTDLTVGSGAINLAVNDLDGDGRFDIVTANNGATGNGTTVSILRNTTPVGATTLSFATAAAYSVGTGPYSVALGDINGDGKLDVVAANYGASGTSGTGATVSVLRSTSTSGTLSFATKADYSVGNGVNDVKLGDIDGDGDLDIITANQDASTTSVRLNGNTGAAVPLPVTLVAFTAQPVGALAVRLDWATASEVNSARFEVERSRDGVVFATIGTVAAAGSSNTSHAYQLTDSKLPTGSTRLYYRLRQVDLDGTAVYSPVQVVELGKGEVTIMPNPAHTSAQLLGAPAGVLVQVFNALGQVVVTKTTDEAGTAELTLPQGLYLVCTGQQVKRLVVE